MARPIWSGTISFGLVSIPVKLYNAVARKSVSFNQLDARTGARIRMKKTSAADGSDVPEDQIVKGYEISKDRYVVVEPEELDALDPAATRTIDLEDFVDLAEIDPIYYDSPYYLAPDKGAAKPYALLTRAMEESGKVGIARFVMRTKQYLAAIRVADGHLVLSTMVYADEVVDPASIEGLQAAEEVELSERELTMARQLIESLTAPFEPERYHDEYRERVLDLIERKAAGEEIAAPAPEPAAARVVDLMAALEASVRDAKAARGRHPSAAAEAAADGAVDEAADTGEGEPGDDKAADRDGARGGTRRRSKAGASAGAAKAAPARKRKSA